MNPFNSTSCKVNTTDATAKEENTQSKFITLCICWVAIVIGNSLVIAVQKIYARKQIPNFLIQVLAWIDILNALGPVLISMVMYKTSSHGFEGMTHKNLCYFYNTAATMLRLSACFLMTMMALDRATSVEFPVYYRTKLRRRTMKRWVMFLLGIAFIIACLPLMGLSKVYAYESVCSFDFGSEYAVGIVIIGYLQLLIVLICYIVVVKGLFGFIGRQVARRKEHSFIEMTSSARAKLASRRKSSSGMMMRDISNFRIGKKFAKMTGLISFLFYVSWMPIVLSITVQLSTGKYSPTLQFLSARMSLICSIANPIAYALLSAMYRRGYVYCLRWLLHLCGGPRPKHPVKKSAILGLLTENRSIHATVLPRIGSPYFIVNKSKARNDEGRENREGKRVRIIAGDQEETERRPVASARVSQKCVEDIVQCSSKRVQGKDNVSFEIDAERIEQASKNSSSDDEIPDIESSPPISQEYGILQLGFDGDSEGSDGNECGSEVSTEYQHRTASKSTSSPITARGKRRKVKRKTLSEDLNSVKKKQQPRQPRTTNLLQLPRNSLSDEYATDRTDATDLTDIEPEIEMNSKI